MDVEKILARGGGESVRAPRVRHRVREGRHAHHPGRAGGRRGGGGTGTAPISDGDSAARPDSPPEPAPTAHDAAPLDPGRTGAGGGFGGLVLPSGAYVVKGDQVRWVPAVDTTIVVLASLGLVRVLARTWTRWRTRQS